MMSSRQEFWNFSSFAVIGNSGRMPFPELTYRGLKRAGKKVYPVDPKAGVIDGDSAVADITALPQKVEAMVLEVPSDETEAWLRKASELGIRNVWIHMGSESPGALAFGMKAGLNVLSGACAVMYLWPSSFPHCVHKWIMKLAGKY